MDTTVTLMRRLVRGEKWYLSHRTHYYQRMTNIGMSHKKVTVIDLVFCDRLMCCRIRVSFS